MVFSVLGTHAQQILVFPYTPTAPFLSFRLFCSDSLILPSFYRSSVAFLPVSLSSKALPPFLRLSLSLCFIPSLSWCCIADLGFLSSLCLSMSLFSLFFYNAFSIYLLFYSSVSRIHLTIADQWLHVPPLSTAIK